MLVCVIWEKGLFSLILDSFMVFVVLWEIAGNSNTYNGQYDGYTYVSIPLKRLKSNN